MRREERQGKAWRGDVYPQTLNYALNNYMDKHSSLLCPTICEEEKSFITWKQDSLRYSCFGKLVMWKTVLAVIQINFGLFRVLKGIVGTLWQLALSKTLHFNAFYVLRCL